MGETRYRWGLAVGLAVVTLAVYARTLAFDFVNIDDPVYITENARVKQGLTAANVRFAFTSAEGSNYWHPLTWLSHMLDVRLYGLRPAGHHATSVLFHVANTVLLFWVLAGMNDAVAARRAAAVAPRAAPGWPGRLWAPFVAAGAFGLHPLHVESVAWVSERKDVLSTFWWFLGLATYLRYAQTRTRFPGRGRALGSGWGWYFGTLACFVAGLMSKPMLVTFPFVLLLLDVWPLERGRVPTGSRWAWAGVLMEKLPFLVLAGVASVAAFVTQGRGDMLTPLDSLTLPWRVANAITAYAVYLVRTVWPAGLTVYYPHPWDALPLWKPLAAAALLGAISAASIRRARREPYLLWGWCWYLGTLVPVVGLVQIGSFAMADRYTYVPLVGGFVMLAWAAAARLRTERAGAWVAAALILLLQAGLTWVQLAHWRNSETLFTRQLALTGGDMVGHDGLGMERLRENRLDEAAWHFAEAVRHQPGLAAMHAQLGGALSRLGRAEEAIAAYREALRLRPNLAEARMNLGVTLGMTGRLAEALEEMEAAVRLAPRNAEARSNLGILLYRLNRHGEALAAFREAVEMDPASASARNNLGRMLLSQGHPEAAAAEFREALRLSPDYPEALANLDAARQALK